MADRAPSEPEAESPAHDAAPVAPTQDRSSDRFPWWVITGLPVVIAAFSLAFSLFIWYEGNRPPEIELTLPDRMRVTQGQDVAWLYIQPRFVSTSPNDRIDGISEIQVVVSPLGNDAPILFLWDEQGSWAFDHDTRSLTWDWVADPGPLVVSPANPQLPTGLFMAKDGWLWEAGAYLVTVTAETTVSDEVLSANSSFTLSEDAVMQLDASPGSLFLTLDLTAVA
ncbi:hypothetical protein BH23CHL4_BH23CHL4_11320 [soil metagenome]